MRSLGLFDGAAMPALGLGTWHMGESTAQRKAEVAAIRAAIGMGYRLIDTAEMYGEGGAEEVVGQAVAEALRAGDVRREELFIVSKVYPHNASRKGTPAACARSLARLGLDHVDLYLLHWRGGYSLDETCDAMRSLVAQGRIQRWGVSNFDTDDMEELAERVRRSAGLRGEPGLLLGRRARRGVQLAALAARARDAADGLQPDRPGRAGRRRGAGEIAQRLGVSAAQLALAWVLAQPGVVAIPKAVREAHLQENLAAAELTLGAEDSGRDRPPASAAAAQEAARDDLEPPSHSGGHIGKWYSADVQTVRRIKVQRLVSVK